MEERLYSRLQCKFHWKSGRVECKPQACLELISLRALRLAEAGIGPVPVLESSILNTLYLHSNQACSGPVPLLL